MADSIRVTMTPERLTVQPDGAPVESVITIQNAGATVDQYAVELDQLPTTLYSLSNTSVALFPQDREDAKLVIHPPKGGAKAGAYPFTVTVLSRADASQTTRVEGLLQVGTLAAFDLSMSPAKQTGRKGNYTLNVGNGGNADIDVALEATDSEDGCRYNFKPKELHLNAGQKTSVRLQVRPRRSGLVGARKNFDFQVKATPSAGPTKTANGQLVHKPIFRTWRPIRRFILLVILIAAISAVAVYVHGNQNSLESQGCTHVSFFCTKTNGKAIPTPMGTQVATTGKPGFIGAFAQFHKYDPSLVGEPLESESTNQRIATQRTSTGLLLFDRKDGHTFLIEPNATVWEYAGGGARQVR